MIKIENVLTEKELTETLSEVRRANWLVNGFMKSLEKDGNDTTMKCLNAWPEVTKGTLLKLMKINENKSYKGIYHRNS